MKAYNYLVNKCTESNSFSWGLSIVGIVIVVIIALV